MLWSEEEDDEDGGQEASQVYKMIRAAVDDDGALERRQEIVLMLASILQLLMKLLLCLLSSYKEQRSSIAALFLHLQTLQAIVGKGRSVAKRRRVEKEWWVKPRLLECDKFVAGRMDRESSLRLFNMRPETFEWLCCQLAPLVHKNDTNFRSSIPPRKRIAIGIHRLACGSSYSEVSKMFAVGEATVLTCTREVYAALSAAFGHVLTFPRQGAALNKVMRGFHALAALPNCCGLLAVVRLKIKRPSGPSGSSYLDDDRNFSIAAQLVVDASMRLLNVAVGFPGGVHDAKILKHSALFDKVRDGVLLNGCPVEVLDSFRSTTVAVPQYLISNSSDYPLLPWLMLPYNTPRRHEHGHEAEDGDGDEEDWKSEFNKRLKQVGMLGNGLFQALRKWQVLDKVMNVDVHTAVELMVACAILHNLLLDKNNNECYYEEEEEEEAYVEETVRAAEVDAHRIRDALAGGVSWELGFVP